MILAGPSDQRSAAPLIEQLGYERGESGREWEPTIAELEVGVRSPLLDAVSFQGDQPAWLEPVEKQQGARDSRGQRQAVIGEAAVEFVPPLVVVEEEGNSYHSARAAAGVVGECALARALPGAPEHIPLGVGADEA